MNRRRLNKIKTLSDIKLEKAKLRYDLLVAENKLSETFETIEAMATFPSFFSRISDGFEIAQTVYIRISRIIERINSWRSKRKKKKRKKFDDIQE